jgi:surfactin synthase thioesterase subunit
MRTPKVNLFFLPFSGGSCYSYNAFIKQAPDYFRIIPLELPGRGRKLVAPFLDSVTEMVDHILSEISDQLHEPYAIYGHSLGTLVGYELVKKIISEDLPQPIHLFFSGRAGPSIEYLEKTRHLLPKEQFIQKVLEMGGSPAAVFADEEMSDFFEPILRADFKAAETYEYQKTKPFDIPIDAMIGRQEKISYEQAMTWQQETTSNTTVLQFDGGHFFIFDHLKAIINRMSLQLQNQLLQINSGILGA